MAHVGIDHPHARGFLQSLLLVPEIELVALCESDPGPVRAVAEAMPAVGRLPVYRDVGRLLELERPEAVLITLPNDVTPDAVVQAAKAGAHVYAEKPCARTAFEFMPAADAIRQTGVQFMTGYLRRSSPVGLAIKDMVDRGLFGQLISIEARWITTSVGTRDRLGMRDAEHYLFSRRRSGGGILHWLGCHWIDYMRWATSAEVCEVSAIAGMLSAEATGVEHTAALALRYTGGWARPEGMIGTLHCSYVTDGARDQLFFGLRGTLGWAYWERDRPEFTAHSAHPDWTAASTRTVRYDPDPVDGYGGAMGIAALRCFLASFRKEAEPLFTADDALRVLQVLDAARESAVSGQRVRVEA
jgi:predicted dehydrogenase